MASEQDCEHLIGGSGRSHLCEQCWDVLSQRCLAAEARVEELENTLTNTVSALAISQERSATEIHRLERKVRECESLELGALRERDALQARVEELERENAALWSDEQIQTLLAQRDALAQRIEALKAGEGS